MVDKFDFGMFLPVTNNGMIASTAPEYQYMPTFELNRDACVDAENTGYSFALAQTKWRGYGGKTELWDYATESLTLMSGIAASTKRIELIASVSLPLLHPGVCARMAATIDAISNGRLILNIVAGWNKMEYAPMGLWPGDDYYRYRYEYAVEYVEVLRGLWEKGRLTHKGKYFNLDDCICQPLPKRSIPLCGAGQSDAGMKAAAQWADYNFIMPNAELTTLDLSTRTQTFARQVGRSVRSYALLAVIAEETDAKAEAVLDHINETVDVEAVETWRRLGQADATGSSAQRHRADAFMGVLPIVGSYKTVADRFCELHAQGLGGAAMVFPNWGRDVKKFGENVITLVDAALLGNDVRLTKKSA